MGNLLNNGQVVVKILRVKCYLVSIGVAFVHTIPRVLHRKNMHLKHVLDEGKKFHSKADILSIAVEIYQNF